MTTKADLVDWFFLALFGPERDRERVLRRSRALEYPEAEKGRVQSLIRQMQADDAEESIRIDAQRAFENGDTEAFKYLRVEPKEELLAKGRFETIEAVLAHQHDIRTTTKRRVLVPRVLSLFMEGVIDNEQLICCRWYRDCWEATGLVGQIPSTEYGKEVFAPPQSRDMFTNFQIDAQENYRIAKSHITARYVSFFEAVVLDDIGLQRAIKLAKKRESKAKMIFRECVEELQTAYEKLKR